MTIETARTRLAEMACALQALDGVIADLAAGLPASAERDAMFECQIPYDVPTELVAVVETVREEYLVPAARALARASRVDRKRLEARFWRAQAAFADADAAAPTKRADAQPRVRRTSGSRAL